MDEWRGRGTMLTVFAEVEVEQWNSGTGVPKSRAAPAKGPGVQVHVNKGRWVARAARAAECQRSRSHSSRCQVPNICMAGCMLHGFQAVSGMHGLSDMTCFAGSLGPGHPRSPGNAQTAQASTHSRTPATAAHSLSHRLPRTPQPVQ